MVKKALIALILFMSVIPGLTALGVQRFQVKLGLYGPLLPISPHLEVSVLTSSFGYGFSQELGFRFTGIPTVYRSRELVFRTWLSFPDSSSTYFRDKFRLGIEYSPSLTGKIFFRQNEKWYGGLRLAACALFYGDAADAYDQAFFLSLGTNWIWEKEFGWHAEKRLSLFDAKKTRLFWPVWISLDYVTDAPLEQWDEAAAGMGRVIGAILLIAILGAGGSPVVSSQLSE